MKQIKKIKYGETVRKCLDLLNAGTPIYFWDTETTGLDVNQDRIITFSAIKVHMHEDRLLEIIDSLDLMIDPQMHISDKASAVNGITDEMVAGCPTEEEAYHIIRGFLGKKPFLAGYNSVKFDQAILNGMYMRAAGTEIDPLMHVDVLNMAKEKLIGIKHTLKNVVSELGCDEGFNFHQSMDDVYATARVFKLLLEYYNREEEPPVQNQKIEVKDLSYWPGKNKFTRRVYVKTYPQSDIYYDIHKEAWVSEDETIDLNHVRENALLLFHAKNEEDMVKKAMARKEQLC